MNFADYGIEVPPGKSGEIDVMCPKCGGQNRTKRINQKERTLSINTVTGRWFCHHCDFRGGLSMSSRTYGPPTPLVTVMNDKSRLYAWFEQRGISREVVDRNRVKTHQTEKGTAIAFPHYRNGEHVHTAFRALSSKKVMWQDSGTERIFWGLDDITGDTAIICEGHPDKLAWEMAGFTNVLSVPDGAGVGDGKLTYLQSASDLLDNLDRVYLALDDDKPGQELMHELARRIGIGKCWIVAYPGECKDANDVLLEEEGRARLRECIDTATPYPVDGIYTLDGLRDDVYEYLAFGADRGVEVGFPELDQYYRPRLGTVTVVTGISGHGKSEWVDQIMVRIAKKHGWPFGIFSPEDMPPYEHAVELAEILLRKPHTRFQHNEIDLVWDFLNDHMVYVLPESYTIDAILERMRIAVLQHGIRGVILNPWNMIESERPKDLSETEYVSVVMTRLTKFAQQNGVHIWLIAHPAKYENYAGRKEEPVPGLNDIASSGNFRNKCDYGIVIWRDIYDETRPAMVSIQKVRHKATGKTGRTFFRLDHQTRNIEEVPDPKRLTIMAGGRSA